MINFNCPHCGNAIKAGEATAGRRGKCRGCGEIICVPPSGSPPDFATENGGQGAVGSDAGRRFPRTPSSSAQEEAVRLIELTSKKWKMKQLVGGLLMLGGTVVGIAALCIIAVITDRPKQSDPILGVIALYSVIAISCLAWIVGLCLYVVGRVGAWWHHG